MSEEERAVIEEELSEEFNYKETVIQMFNEGKLIRREFERMINNINNRIKDLKRQLEE